MTVWNGLPDTEIKTIKALMRQPDVGRREKSSPTAGTARTSAWLCCISAGHKSTACTGHQEQQSGLVVKCDLTCLSSLSKFKGHCMAPRIPL